MADRVGITIELIGKDAAISGLQQVQTLVNGLNGNKTRINVDTSGVRSAQSALSSMFNTVGSISKGIGGTLSTLGRGMTTSGMFLRRIHNMFGGTIFNRASYFVIHRGLRLINQGLDNSVSRFDTFRTFPKLMEAIGYSATDSQNAIEKLNTAVLGLPTSLNEIVETSKPFIQLYNDINKGTDLAIAANNAFLANATNAADQANGLAQLEDLLTKGELTSTEWQSLLGSMGISMQYVAEQLGYGKDRMDEFREQLVKGEIDAHTFLDALIAAGTGTGKLAQMADISKDTMSAALQNVSTAFANLGASAMETFDEILQENTGAGLVDNIVKISDAIKQKVKPAVSGWMKDNADSIVGFFQKLAGFNWGKLASSVVDNAGQIMDFFGKIVDKVGEDNIIKFISFSMTWAGPLSKALTLFGRPLSYLGTLFTKFGRLSQRAGRFFGSGLGRAGTTAVGMGGFGAAFAFLGEIAAVGGLIAEFTKVAEVVAKADLTGFEDNIGTIAAFLGTGGLVTGILTTLGILTSEAGLTGAALAGEGLTAGFEGLVAGVGGLILEFTKIAESVSTADLTNFETNVSKIGKFLGVAAGATGGATTLFGLITGLTGGAGGLVAGIGELLTAGTIANIQSVGDMISQYVDLAVKISDADLPSESKMVRVGKFLTATNDAFDQPIDIDKAKVESVNNALEAVKEIALHLGAFNIIADSETDFTGASTKITEIVSTLSEISKAMYENFPETSWETGEQSNIMKNMLGVVDNLKQSIPIFKDIQSTIDEIGALGLTEETGTVTVAGVTTTNKRYISDKFQGTVNQIKEIVQGMESISNEISADGSIIATLHDRIVTSWEDNIVKNYTDVMSKINGLIAVVAMTDPTKAGIGGAPQGAIDPFTQKRNQVKQLLHGVTDMMTEVSSQVPLLGTALKWFDSSANKHILDNLNKSMDAIGNIIQSTNVTMASMDTLSMDKMPDFKEQVTTFMESMKEITNAFTGQGFSQNAADMGIDYGMLSENLTNLGNAMNGVREMISQVAQMQEDLETLSGGGEGGSVMAQLSATLSGLRVALSQIPEDVDDVQERAEKIKTAVDSVQEIITTMIGMYENLGVLQGDGTVEQMGSVISSIVGALTGGDDVEAATAQIQALSDFIANLNTNLTTLSTVDFSALIDSASQLQSGMESLKGALDDVYSSLQNVARGAIQATTAINNLANTAQSRAGAFGGLIGAMGSLSGALSGAAGSANALTAAINAIPSYKSVTVAYNQVGSPGAASVGGGGGGAWATGGLIPQYRAFGGTIFAMRPKGSDTVPAMLTPGEFVLRKKAVDTLGVPFLRALNGLNIPSAIDRLTAGLRMPAGFGMVSNDNRRIYNNNQKVNQNIYTNNPSYANRRANRWAKSL